MMLFVVLVSALGSYIHATVSFSDFVGNRQLAASWMWWYLLRVFVGSSLAVIFYFAIRGGFFSGASNSTDLNVYGIAALAGLAEPRKVRLTSSTTLKVTLLAKDAKEAGRLTFTVTNPQPGGGTSQPLVVDVTDPA
jgi:hypothetical protein